MNNLVQFPEPRKAMREAAEWVVAMEEGLSDDERLELQAWLEADRRNPKALLKMAEIWEVYDVLAELAEIFPIDRYRDGRRRASALRIGAAVAAAAGIAALGLYLVLGTADRPYPETISVSLPTPSADTRSINAGAAARSTYQTVIGEQLSARLSDGSVVTLNTNTLLEIDYSGSERLVTIERGEASFNVTRDPAWPFRVRANDKIVQAVGTLFNVHLESDDRVEVTVTEGSVRVMRADPPSVAPAASVDVEIDPVVLAPVNITVAAGEIAVIGDGASAVRPIDSLEIEAKLAWQQGMLVFQGSPLEEALADMSRYTTVKFRIADESIRQRRVGGYFRAGDIDALLLALRESFGIETERQGDEIVLTARN